MATQVGTKMATQASGNTNPEAVAKPYSCPKKRAFLLTFNEDPLSNCNTCVVKFKSLKTCDYLICCQEFNKAGNLHCHLYVHFENAYSIPAKLIKNTKMHIDVAYGSPKQNIEYVKKEGSKWDKKRSYQKTEIIEEYGSAPTQGQLSIKELRAIENSDDLPDWKQYNTWKSLKQEHKKTKVDEWHKTIDVIYIQGPSGVGKSLKAVEIMKERGITEFDEAKHIGDFWHNVDGTGCCVYDDFRDSHMKPSEFINFIDYNIHNLNVKGGSVRNLYSTIIITSVQRLDCIYLNMANDEPRQQWERRIKVIDLYQD